MLADSVHFPVRRAAQIATAVLVGATATIAALEQVVDWSWLGVAATVVTGLIGVLSHVVTVRRTEPLVTPEAHVVDLVHQVTGVPAATDETALALRDAGL